MTPSVVRGFTPFCLSGAVGGHTSWRGSGLSFCHVATSRRQEAHLRRSAESESCSEISESREYLGNGRGRAFALADWFPPGGGKTSGLRTARFPPSKSAGTVRRPTRDASFSETRGVRDRSRCSGKKSSSGLD